MYTISKSRLMTISNIIDNTNNTISEQNINELHDALVKYKDYQFCTPEEFINKVDEIRSRDNQVDELFKETNSFGYFIAKNFKNGTILNFEESNVKYIAQRYQSITETILVESRKFVSFRYNYFNAGIRTFKDLVQRINYKVAACNELSLTDPKNPRIKNYSDDIIDLLHHAKSKYPRKYGEYEVLHKLTQNIRHNYNDRPIRNLYLFESLLDKFGPGNENIDLDIISVGNIVIALINKYFEDGIENLNNAYRVKELLDKYDDNITDYTGGGMSKYIINKLQANKKQKDVFIKKLTDYYCALVAKNGDEIDAESLCKMYDDKQNLYGFKLSNFDAVKNAIYNYVSGAGAFRGIILPNTV